MTSIVQQLGLARVLREHRTRIRALEANTKFGLNVLKDYQVYTPIGAIVMINIPQVYSHLLYVSEVQSNNINTTADGMRFNADASGSYNAVNVRADTGVVNNSNLTGLVRMVVGWCADTGGTEVPAANMIMIPNYSRTTGTRGAVCVFGERSTAHIAGVAYVSYNGAGAVTSITRLPDAGSYVTPSRFTLYGMMRGYVNLS